MWFIRRMLRIPWTDMKKNKEVLEMAEIARSLLRKIKARQCKFIGHVMRRNGMENLTVIGKIENKRSRGRQRQKMIDDSTRWLGMEKNTHTIRKTYERTEWRTLIANAGLLGTQ